MKSHARIAASLIALIAIAGCASTEVTERRTYQGERI